MSFMDNFVLPKDSFISKLLPTFLILVALVVLILRLYLPSLANWAVADDFISLQPAANPVRRYDFTKRLFFRPFEQLAIGLNVSLLGYENLLLARSVGLIGFLISIACVYRLGRLVNPASILTAVWATTFFAVSPLATMNVIQIDTISQQYATAFSLLCLLCSLRAATYHLFGFYLLSYLCALLALLSKEAATGILAVVPLAVLLIRWDRMPTTPRQALQELTLGYAGLILVVGLYIGLRQAADTLIPLSGEERYGLTFSPTTIIKNFVLFGGSLLYAGSSLDLFPSLKSERLVLSMALTLILLAISVVGALYITLARSRHRRPAAVPPVPAMPMFGLLLLTFAGFFPVVLLKHVSERFVYNSLPFAALLLGLCFVEGTRTLAQRLKATYFVPCTAAGFSVGLALWLALGTQEKIASVTELAEKSRLYFHQAMAFFQTAPEEDISLCWQDNNDGSSLPRYSVIVLPDQLVFDSQLANFVSSLTNKSIRICCPAKNPCQLYDYEIRVDKDGIHFQPPREPL